jgi:inorganic pyrophosphatase
MLRHVFSLRRLMPVLATALLVFWVLRRARWSWDGASDGSSVGVLASWTSESGASPAAYATRSGTRISYWHDVPLRVGDGRVAFVCEVPQGTTAKLEVATGEALTPLRADTDKRGRPRELAWPALVNYGMLPQTLEGPTPDATGASGDGDPLDALDLWPAPCAPGEVFAARVVGALAFIDGDRADWKILVVRDHGGIPAALVSDVAELLPQLESLDEEAGRGREPSAYSIPDVRAGDSSRARITPAEAPVSLHPDALATALFEGFPSPARAHALSKELHAAAAARAAVLSSARGGEADTAAARTRLGPGATHAHAPPALIAALERIAGGGILSSSEAAVARLGTRIWLAVRLVSLRDWFMGYKAAAAAQDGDPPPTVPARSAFNGAFLDADTARRVIALKAGNYEERGRKESE